LALLKFIAFSYYTDGCGSVFHCIFVKMNEIELYEAARRVLKGAGHYVDMDTDVRVPIPARALAAYQRGRHARVAATGMIALLPRALKWLRFPVFVDVITNKPNIPAGTNIIEGTKKILFNQI
jgi:hypothetical protein